MSTKHALLAVLTLFLFGFYSSSLEAKEDPRLVRKIHRIERYLYGEAQKGKLEERLSGAHKDLLGRDTPQVPSDKADNLYRFLFKGTQRIPSLDMKISFLEWKIFHESRRGKLIERIDALDKLISGKVSNDPLAFRVEQLVQLSLDNGFIGVRTVKLPRGSRIQVRLDRALSTKSAQPGDEFVVSVTDDLIVERNVLIVPKGGYASGDVEAIRRPGRFGRSGRIRLTVNEVSAIDSTIIPVTIEDPKESFDKKKIGLAVGASAVGYIALGGPVGLVGGIFVKGKDAVIPEGTELWVTTLEDIRLNGVVINRK